MESAARSSANEPMAKLNAHVRALCILKAEHVPVFPWQIGLHVMLSTVSALSGECISNHQLHLILAAFQTTLMACMRSCMEQAPSPLSPAECFNIPRLLRMSVLKVQQSNENSSF